MLKVRKLTALVYEFEQSFILLMNRRKWRKHFSVKIQKALHRKCYLIYVTTRPGHSQRLTSKSRHLRSESDDDVR